MRKRYIAAALAFLLVGSVGAHADFDVLPRGASAIIATLLKTANSWTAGQAVTPTVGGTQSAGGTYTPDFSVSNSVTLIFGAGNLTIANPNNIKAGQSYIIDLTQDGTGSRTVTWGPDFKWQAAAAPTLSTAANAEDVISCWAATISKLICTLAVKGAG